MAEKWHFSPDLRVSFLFMFLFHLSILPYLKRGYFSCIALCALTMCFVALLPLFVTNHVFLLPYVLGNYNFTLVHSAIQRLFSTSSNIFLTYVTFVVTHIYTFSNLTVCGMTQCSILPKILIKTCVKIVFCIVPYLSFWHPNFTFKF
jgi:hypothetical protein